MQLEGKDVCLGRVIHEDDDFMQFEIVKNESRKLNLVDGDRFFTFVFVRASGDEDAPDNELEVFKPWE